MPWGYVLRQYVKAPGDPWGKRVSVSDCNAPWTINGWAPAGGARSTPADMVRYARALLDGSAPGMDALTPQWDILQGTQQIGYGWQRPLYSGHLITFKNGLTGGFTSKIALDRDNDRAVIVLSNTAAQVDDAADGLLVGDLAWVSAPRW
jgi:CubicO group peptidase (beta-lactamase class C family)